MCTLLSVSCYIVRVLFFKGEWVLFIVDFQIFKDYGQRIWLITSLMFCNQALLCPKYMRNFCKCSADVIYMEVLNQVCCLFYSSFSRYSAPPQENILVESPELPSHHLMSCRHPGRRLSPRDQDQNPQQQGDPEDQHLEKQRGEGFTSQGQERHPSEVWGQ